MSENSQVQNRTIDTHEASEVPAAQVRLLQILAEAVVNSLRSDERDTAREKDQ